MSNKCIAFVDDEMQILRALRRLFTQTDYECLFFDSANEFLQYSGIGDVDLLITDIRMPNTDGIELMKQVKQMHPEIIRVALSGYTDSRQILSALESGLAKLYIYKPWENDELLKIIAGLLEMKDSLNDIRLLEIINSISSLPTLPVLYQKISQMVEKSESASRIAGEIENDPVIALKLLRVANTAYYGSKIGSVQQALVMLGMTNVKQIILTNTVFAHKDIAEYGEILWQQAALTNRIVNYFYEQLHNKHMPTHQSAVGLMHSIGIVFVSSMLAEGYQKIINHCSQQEKYNIIEAEMLSVNLTHMQLGSYLLNWWEMPYSMVEACFYYRDPLNEAVIDKEIVGLVHIASHCAWHCLGAPMFQFELKEEVCNRWGISKNMMQHAIKILGQDKAITK